MRRKVLRKMLRKYRKLDARLDQLDKWARARKLKELRREPTPTQIETTTI
jgi:hypothetical protein